MKTRFRRAAAMVLTGVLFGCLLSGCGGETGETKKKKAMGRYLESDIPMPVETDGMYFGLTELKDKTVCLASSIEGKQIVWELKEDGLSWKEKYEFTIDTQGYEEVFVADMSISPAGDAVAIVHFTNGGEDAEWISGYYHISTSGEVTKIPYEGKDTGYFLQYPQEGVFYTLQVPDGIQRIDVATGEEKIIAGEGSDITGYGIVEDKLYGVDYEGGIQLYDRNTGDPLKKNENLEKSIQESGISTSGFSSNAQAVLFCAGQEEGSVFYSNATGLYGYKEEGNVNEKIINGELSSLGSPEVGLCSMVAAEENIFYMLIRKEERSQVIKYEYSPDTPTTPEKEISVYSLYDNGEVRQAIANYQKTHPEVYIQMEVGVTDANGITSSDALRTLSTEIAAGKGPDLMVLDGMPLESYIEKGLLEDVSEIVQAVDEKEGLFTNLTSVGKEDGAQYAVPLRCSIPVIQGNSGVLNNITDLKSLADEAERLRQENPEQNIFVESMDGLQLAIQLYDSSSASWITKEKTIDSEALSEFYRQLKRIYDVDTHQEQNEAGEILKELLKSESSIGNGLLCTYAEKTLLNVGGIATPVDAAMLATASREQEKIIYQSLSGQTERPYLPKIIAGINSKGREKEGAKEFLTYLLGEEAQSASQGSGLAVNKKALQKALQAESLGNSTIGISDSDDPDSVIIMKLKALTTEEFDALAALMGQLKTPALSNAIIREAVLEQAKDIIEGTTEIEEGVKQVVDKVNLYLAEG